MELFVSIALVYLYAVWSGAVFESSGVGLDMRREDDVDEVVEPLFRQVPFDNWDRDRHVAGRSISHTDQWELLRGSCRSDVVA